MGADVGNGDGAAVGGEVGFGVMVGAEEVGGSVGFEVGLEVRVVPVHAVVVGG